MIPLIDADVLVYEVGFGVMTGWEGDDPPPFDMARELLERKIDNICAMVGATAPPILYLTGSGNFREQIATLKPYKGTRFAEKPYHFNNLRNYLVGVLGAITVDGMEADDAMSIEQVRNDRVYHSMLLSGKEEGCIHTIICSRDKDLKQVPGWHYSWEMGNQPSFGPEECTDYGWIKISENRKKLFGMGDKFFLAQCLMGDKVDNIGGIPKYGPAKAFDLLSDTQTYPEGLSLVLEAYKGFYGDDGEKYLLENGQLLWMVRELDKEGKPVMWEM